MWNQLEENFKNQLIFLFTLAYINMLAYIQSQIRGNVKHKQKL